jgi:hypothetical protein
MAHGQRGAFRLIARIRFESFFFDFRLERRAVTVKSLTSVLSVLVVAFGLAGMPGCGADNESDASKASGDLAKDPGAPANKSKADTSEAPITDMKDYAARQQGQAKGALSEIPGGAPGKKQ